MEAYLCAALSSAIDTPTGNYDQSIMIVKLLLLLSCFLLLFSVMISLRSDIITS